MRESEITVNGRVIDFITFPSGVEYHTKFQIDDKRDSFHIKSDMKESGDIMKLLLVTDILRRQKDIPISLFIPYLPYARQDRVTDIGTPFSLKVFASIINSQNYASVHIFDPHSNVSTALINNSKAVTSLEFYFQALTDLKEYAIVTPDVGAVNRVFDVAQSVAYRGSIIQGIKHRDIASGKITGVEVLCGDLGGKTCVIIDDICSKGGTFIGLSEELKKKGAGNVHLIVSHYEDSADEMLLRNHLTSIHTTDSLVSSSRNNDFLKIHKLNGLFSQ